VVYNFGRGEVSMVAVEVSYNLAGRTIRDLTVPGEFNVISITRDDKAFLPSAGTEFREGDILHIAIQSSALPRLEEMLGLERRS
jgi:trk system potassium uptake protein TrkA